MKSNEILYSEGNNDECYTPGYAVTPIIKYIKNFNIYKCDINLNTIEHRYFDYFDGQNIDVEVQNVWENDICVTVPTVNKNGQYQKDGDGTDYIVLPKSTILDIRPVRDIVVWCPFDKEESEFVKQIIESGYNVIASHIDNGQDFYNYEPEKWDIIISNPPFTNKRGIFERALSFGKPFALIMSNTWLNDSAPKQLFKDKDLQLLMFDKRIKYNDNNKITFSSSYYCYNFLPKQIIMEELKEK